MIYLLKKVSPLTIIAFLKAGLQQTSILTSVYKLHYNLKYLFLCESTGFLLFSEPPYIEERDVGVAEIEAPQVLAKDAHST